MAIRFFAGGDLYDLMAIHGVGYISVFISVWGVVDVINNSPLLKIKFPTHDEQEVIARGFQAMSGAGFDNVIGAIDGVLIWIRKPSKKEATANNGCGDRTFFCARKNKFGMNMQAICDHHFRFRWIDISWPGSTADYMAWVTSDLYTKIESNGLNKLGMTLLGDNAYVKSRNMTIPVKGAKTHVQDAYNFYHSQLRITIERAFGILVHRWGILRGPLVFPLLKVSPFICCLCCLHNYCIDQRIMRQNANEKIEHMVENDAYHISDVVYVNNEIESKMNGQKVSNSMLTFSNDGRANDLTGSGEHFHNCPHRVPYEGEDTPMDEMLELVRCRGLTRP